MGGFGPLEGNWGWGKGNAYGDGTYFNFLSAHCCVCVCVFESDERTEVGGSYNELGLTVSLVGRKRECEQGRF